MLVPLTRSRTDADELEPIVEQIFEAMHSLCIKWKARSFLLIDVPPMYRSPGGIDVVIHNDPATEIFCSAKEKRLVSMMSVTRRGIPSYFDRQKVLLQIHPRLRYLSSHLNPSFQICWMILKNMGFPTV